MLTSIKVTIDDNYVFDLENMIYFTLLSMRKFSITICIDDLTPDKDHKSDLVNITNQIAFLEKCGIQIDGIIKYSEYTTLCDLYLDRAVDLGAKKIESASDSLIMYENQILSMNGRVRSEFYDALIDYTVDFDYAYRLVGSDEGFAQINSVINLLRFRESKIIRGIYHSDMARCPIHLLSSSCFDAVTNIKTENLNSFDPNLHDVQEELKRFSKNTLNRLEKTILNLDTLIESQTQNNFRRILIDPIAVKLQGSPHSLSVENQNICLKGSVYLDKSFKDTVKDMNTDSIKVRMRFGTNIVVRKKNDEIVGTIDTSKKKKSPAFNWLPSSDKLFRFMTDAGSTIIYLPGPESIYDKTIGIVRYDNRLMYAIPEYTKTEEGDNDINNFDWFSLPDLDSDSTNGSREIKIEQHRLLPVIKS
jgi:hypothetical protein